MTCVGRSRVWNQAAEDIAIPSLDGHGSETQKQWLEVSWAERSKTAILIDGLDAFVTPEDGERLMRRLKAIMENFPNVYFVCSLHRGIHVNEVFGDLLDEHYLQSEETKADMSSFIHK
jgi:PAS domain-containing protein